MPRINTITMCGIFLLAQQVSATEIAITLKSPPREGTITFQLFDSPNTFGDLRDPVLSEQAPLDGREVYVLTNVPTAEYALVVYYDENGNGILDKNFIGIPREPLGFSNNYQPKGPPSYARAAFDLETGLDLHFEVQLEKPLGERGRIGIGPGVLIRSTPYKGYDDAVYQFIPALTYTGNRIQWFGPRVQCGVIGSGRVRIAAMGEYRMAPYEADGSTYLAGMDDAESTFMTGLSLQCELPGGLDLTLESALDAFDRIGGYDASCSVDKSYQMGILRLSPGLAVNWMDRKLAANDFGVEPNEATLTRPAYDPGDSTGIESRVGLFVEITRDWLLAASVAVEWFDEHATDSPIIDQNHVLKAFATINYVF